MAGSKKSEKRVERSSDPRHLGGLQLAPGDAFDKIEAKEEVGEGRRGHGQSRLEKFNERQPGGRVLILVSVHGLCEGAKNSMGGVGGGGEGGEDGRLVGRAACHYRDHFDGCQAGGGHPGAIEDKARDVEEMIGLAGARVEAEEEQGQGCENHRGASCAAAGDEILAETESGGEQVESRCGRRLQILLARVRGECVEDSASLVEDEQDHSKQLGSLVQVAENVETRTESKSGHASLEVFRSRLILGDQLVEQLQAECGNGPALAGLSVCSC